MCRLLCKYLLEKNIETNPQLKKGAHAELYFMKMISLFGILIYLCISHLTVSYMYVVSLQHFLVHYTLISCPFLRKSFFPTILLLFWCLINSTLSLIKMSCMRMSGTWVIFDQVLQKSPLDLWAVVNIDSQLIQVQNMCDHGVIRPRQHISLT